MNVTLKNQLVKAYNYLCELEKCNHAIECDEGLLRLHTATLNKSLRDYRLSFTKKKNESLSSSLYKLELLLMLLLAIPVGICIGICYLINPTFLINNIVAISVVSTVVIIIIYVLLYFALRKPLANLKEKRELKKDQEYEKGFQESQQDAMEQIKKLRSELHMLYEQRERLQNEASCLEVVPYKYWRTKKDIKALHDYVADGRSLTIEHAMARYSQYNDHLTQVEARNEELERLNRQHRETQNALEQIAKNQERINENLEYLRRN